LGLLSGFLGAALLLATELLLPELLAGLLAGELLCLGLAVLLLARLWPLRSLGPVERLARSLASVRWVSALIG